MRVNDLMIEPLKCEELSLLRERCSQFIDESASFPLLKNLPKEYGDFHRIKVRKRKNIDKSGEFTETFNDVFEKEIKNLRERAVFANGESSFEPAIEEDLEPFFIFPIDGYRYMYSREVENSSHDYKTVFDVIFEQFGADKGHGVISDLLKFTYTSDTLKEGIESGAEMIIYNIPYFYAVRESAIQSYSQLINYITE